uniref:Transcriptional regulator n=1 Tax=Heterorhabditis bacteriophora TaxID=37862 RepID=A0A1I7WRM2_HETBA
MNRLEQSGIQEVVVAKGGHVRLELDYIAVFGARPKVARTPDGVDHRGCY